MDAIGKEATDFIKACQAIQSLLGRGGLLTPTDRDLIKFGAIDLLRTVKQA